MHQPKHKMAFEQWCEHLKRCADTMTNGLINWRNVSFNYAERYLEDEPLATSIDALVASAKDQVTQALQRKV